jgi:sugar phosphate isomerase/epimerase
VDPAAVGVIHDLGFGNLVIEGGEDVRAGLEMLGPYLAHVYVKNCVATGGDGGGRQRPVGARVGGAADRSGRRGAYLRHLTELGYHGWVTVEHFSTEPAAGRADGPEPRLLPGGPGGGAGLTGHDHHGRRREPGSGIKRT